MPKAEIDRDLRPHLPLVLDVREDAPVSGPRVDVGDEIASKTLRDVEQKGGERVGEAVLRRGIGGRGGRRAAEAEDPARAAVVLDLQQKIAVVAQIAANLDRMVGVQFRDASSPQSTYARSGPMAGMPSSPPTCRCIRSHRWW